MHVMGHKEYLFKEWMIKHQDNASNHNINLQIHSLKDVGLHLTLTTILIMQNHDWATWKKLVSSRHHDQKVGILYIHL